MLKPDSCWRPSTTGSRRALNLDLREAKGLLEALP